MKREEKAKLSKSEQFAQLRSDFCTFLYHKEGDEPAVVMGRTALSWGKIGLFFLIYYVCLTAFFAAMFAIAFSTIPEIKDGPKYTSFISDKPLLLVYPNGIGSWKRDDINGSIRMKYENILDEYKDTQCFLMEKCQPNDDYRKESAKKQCGFDLTTLGPCNRDHPSGFGYNKNEPCLYLRLSKIYGWKPEPVQGSAVGLDCHAEGDSKTEFIYHPGNLTAFPKSFWPFRGESAFRTPIAAIQVKGNTKEVKVKCKAIAKNIELSDTYKIRRGAYGQIEFTVAAPPA